MNKDKAIESVLKILGITEFEGLSISYDQITYNDLPILSRKFTEESIYNSVYHLIYSIWEIEKAEKEINENLSVLNG